MIVILWSMVFIIVELFDDILENIRKEKIIEIIVLQETNSYPNSKQTINKLFVR